MAKNSRSSEEGGAEEMLAQGIFRDFKPEAVFGLHVFSTLSAGQIGVLVYALAAATIFAASESRQWGVTLLTLIGVGCDLIMGGLLLFVFRGLSSGVGVLLLITVAMGRSAGVDRPA